MGLLPSYTHDNIAHLPTHCSKWSGALWKLINMAVLYRIHTLRKTLSPVELLIKVDL